VLVTVTYFLVVANLKKPEDYGWLKAAWEKQLNQTSEKVELTGLIVQNLTAIKASLIVSASSDDPYKAFEIWMRSNDFEDVAGCEILEVDLERMHEAIDGYWLTKWNNKCLKEKERSSFSTDR